jgi:hypothetical protein
MHFSKIILCLRMSKATTTKSNKLQGSLSRKPIEKVACSSVHVEFTVSKVINYFILF